MPKYETMGQRIKRRRLHLGLSGEQLGVMCGVSKVSVSNWECGIIDNIKLQTFRRLLEALDVGYEDLIFGPSDEKEDSRRYHSDDASLRAKVHP